MMGRLGIVGLLNLALVANWCTATIAAEAELSGELKLWHRVTLTFQGPQTGERADPNPFRDFRLEVTFKQGDRKLRVPGYFAADGNAAESGATAGNRWRVHFLPPATGKWQYTASFRQGKDVAFGDATAGEPAAFDGAAGSFEIAASDKLAPDFRGQGLLQYTGKRYLSFAGSGQRFLKGGTDSPENLLGYADFDDTKPAHHYQPHVRDWREGDPTWRSGKGKGLIGALNYLASQRVNSIYFLPMNVAGDGKDTWPWVAADVRDRFDVSKLAQWEVVFTHAQRLGILLHFMTQETENDQLLDGGDLGPQRKLYYRELIARFGHHPALVWNLGEENTNTDGQRKDFCRYLHDVDPYDHPVVCHTFPGKYDQVYRPLLGYEYFEGPSLQTNDTHAQTLKWIDLSARAGRPWFVCLDEIGPANTGVKPDANDAEHNDVRAKHLWGHLMAGGAGVEWYFGYKYPHNDLNLEDFRTREKMWQQTAIARDFFATLPLEQMTAADELTSQRNDYCLAQPGELFVVYLPQGGTTELNLGQVQAAYSLQWFNPRMGGPLVEGNPVRGPGKVTIGPPPADADRDWAAVLRLTGEVPRRSLVVEHGTGSGSYPVGARVRIAPHLPPAKRAFSGWESPSDRLDSPDAQVTWVTMPDADITVTATYRPASEQELKAAQGAITAFVLIDTEKNRPLAGFEPLKDGATLELSKLPKQFTIRAVTAPQSVGAVEFRLDGNLLRTERSAPYTLAGDSEGHANPWHPKPGEYRLSAAVVGSAGTGQPRSVRIVVKK